MDSSAAQTPHNYHMRPPQVLALGFLAVILVGTALLCLPISSADGKPLPLLSALFTATTSTCVTGLTVVETGLAFSHFGQGVILLLTQIGGLGFMTAASLLFMLMGKRITLRERLTIAEGLNESSLRGLVRLVKRVVLLTLSIEAAGAVVLSFRMIPLYGVGQGIWMSVFHAVSAFCNAGLDLFGYGNSVVNFQSDPLVLITFMVLIILGGLGFSVIMEVIKKRHWGKFSLHSKVVLFMTGALLLSGTALFFATEFNNPETLGPMSLGDKALNAAFQSTTLRTAGFASLPQQHLSNAGLLLCVLLMFIGASPASTGGGIKTTTAFVLFAQLRAVVKGKNDLNFAGRRLPDGLGRRAVAIICIGLFVLLGLILSISLVEQGNGFTLEEIVYECTSCFGTVGTTMGITGQLSSVSQFLLIIGMYLGRVGPLTLALAFSSRMGSGGARFPEEKIMVG